MADETNHRFASDGDSKNGVSRDSAFESSHAPLSANPDPALTITGKRLSRRAVSVVISAVFMCGIAAGALTVHLVASRPPKSASGEWKPSGDGKTIVNTGTGELRYTSTGRSVAEVNAERQRQAEAEAKRWKAENSRPVYPDLAPRYPGQSVFGQLHDQMAKENGWRNETIEAERQAKLRLDKFVDDHPFSSLGPSTFTGTSEDWEHITRPFRIDQALTQRDKDNLLDFLGRAIKLDKYKNDESFHQAIEDLKQYHPMSEF